MRLRIHDLGVTDGRHSLIVDDLGSKGRGSTGQPRGGRMTPHGPRVNGSGAVVDAMNAYLAEAWPRFEADSEAPEFARWFEHDQDDSDALG